jgi:D-alanyl-D-alanine carboxypeptidase (penicillin-binding protein 5/6)
MLRFALPCLLAAACGQVAPAAAQELDAAPAGVGCEAFLLYDLEQRATLAVYHPGLKQPVASLTKLMTAILACERLRFDGRYVLTAKERATFKVDTMRAHKMLELMLIPSNNAVCRVVARIVSGTEEAFAAEMNAKAAQLGLADTRFANSTGLPADGQYSTLGDVLALTRVALTYPRIRQVLGQREVELAGKCYEGTLDELRERHPGLIGGKTGYTRAAGRCLALQYRARDRDYLLITLHSEDVDSGFRDAELLLSYFGLYDGEVGAWD